jgi:hypothetical protein
MESLSAIPHGGTKSEHIFLDLTHYDSLDIVVSPLGRDLRQVSGFSVGVFYFFLKPELRNLKPGHYFGCGRQAALG